MPGASCYRSFVFVFSNNDGNVWPADCVAIDAGGSGSRSAFPQFLGVVASDATMVHESALIRITGDSMMLVSLSPILQGKTVGDFKSTGQHPRISMVFGVL